MGLGAGELGEVRGDAADPSGVGLSQTVLAAVRSLDIFYRSGGKPLVGLQQGSDRVCPVTPPEVSPCAAS